MSFPYAAFWTARAQLKLRKLSPWRLSLPLQEYGEVAAFVRGTSIGGFPLELAPKSDKCVLWGYDGRPGHEGLIPFVIRSEP